MARIVVGLSGGVDSAAAAVLLQKQGHEVIGVTLRTWESGSSRCCEIDAARETTRALGIPYHIINCVSDFESDVKASLNAGMNSHLAKPADAELLYDTLKQLIR